MKNKLTLTFSRLGVATVTVTINNHEVYHGALFNMEFVFDLQDQNTLKLSFSDLTEPTDITEVYYNHLSIEHFIYQGVFHTESGHSWTGTEITQPGTWTYCFDRDLAKQIIKANT